MKHYHYIFAGSGLSSLMTVYRMAVSGKFDGKSILLIDSDTKQANDRTWCFWEEGDGCWDSIIYKKWKVADFIDEQGATSLDLGAYTYKMIRGLDFYNFVFTELAKHSAIEIITQKVTDFADLGIHVLVKTEKENFTCNKLFNSIYNPALVENHKKYPLLKQHFVGWHIKADTHAFDDKKPTFMDFSIAQNGNTRFMYVLPVAPDEAIIEYTLFSKDLLPQEEYEQAIEDYIKKLGITGYGIVAEERGGIPMTGYPFWKHNTKNIINIGTAGGWTKASTGYTFKNADKKSEALVAFLPVQGDFTKFFKKNRFWLYDLLLLDILSKKNDKGEAIFSALFCSGKAAPVFKFLDEETTLAEDIKVILKCPKPLFIRALISRIANL
jgi:lycopene beta-cyclase